MMDIYLRGSTRFRFPVLPSEYTVRVERQIETVNVGALGEIDLAKGRGLRSVSFSSFFPKQYDSGYCRFSGLPSPKRAVEKLEKILRGAPVKLVITGTPVNFPVRLTSFEWKEDDGTGDIAFSVTFQEHRSIPVQVSSVVADGGKGEAENSSVAGAEILISRDAMHAVSASTYTVVRGDTLTAIARRLTGKSDWRALYEENRDQIGGNPNQIEAGMILRVPGDKE